MTSLVANITLSEKKMFKSFSQKDRFYTILSCAIVFLLVPLVAYILISTDSRDKQLYAQGSITNARVVDVSLAKKSNRWVRYEFEVAGQKMTGTGSYNGHDEVKAGDVIEIVYLPSSPQENDVYIDDNKRLHKN